MFNISGCCAVLDKLFYYTRKGWQTNSSLFLPKNIPTQSLIAWLIPNWLKTNIRPYDKSINIFFVKNQKRLFYDMKSVYHIKFIQKDLERHRHI